MKYNDLAHALNNLVIACGDDDVQEVGGELLQNAIKRAQKVMEEYVASRNKPASDEAELAEEKQRELKLFHDLEAAADGGPKVSVGEFEASTILVWHELAGEFTHGVEDEHNPML